MVSGEIDESISELYDINFEECKTAKVLGMHWTSKADVFKFNVSLAFGGETKYKFIPDIITPRMMLSKVAQIYDPVGFLTPFVLEGKVLMRKSLQLEDCNESKADQGGNGIDLLKIIYVNNGIDFLGSYMI